MSIFDPFEKSFKDLKGSFSGKNSKDPIAQLGATFSVDPLTRGIGDKLSGGNFSENWDGLQTRIPDGVNANFASILHGDGAPSAKSGFKKEANTDAYAEKGNGFGDWVQNKPATTVGALITAAMFGAGALGGAAGESAGGGTAGASGGGSGAASNPWYQDPQKIGGIGKALSADKSQTQGQPPPDNASGELANSLQQQKMRQQQMMQAQLAQMNA